MADCFIKLDEVTGESGDQEFKDHILVTSWAWGVAQQASAGWDRASTGRPQVSDLVFTHKVDYAGPALFTRCARNQIIPNAVLVMRRAGGTAQKYLFIRMKQVRIVSCALLHDAANPIPQERVALAFQQVDFEYAPQSALGTDRSGKAVFSFQTDKS